jgi:RNA polymerase sigma factor (sigma-70 family)
MSVDKNKRTQLEDALLWQETRNGSAAAFNALIIKYTDLLFNYGVRFSQDRDLIKDCIQELFVEIWNKRAVITQPTSVKWYLSVALRNRIFREQTKWNKAETLEEDEYDFLLEFSIESKLIAFAEDMELAQKIRQIIETLPPRQREILFLRYYQNLEYDQIADLMNISKQSVHNLLQKAYNSIRSEWTIFISLLVAMAQASLK